MATNEEVPMEEDSVIAEVPMKDGIPDYPPIEVAPAPLHDAEYEASGPRLMITHITNENFKSYAGKCTLGPFHKSFSAIVGPNGSGKSNVIDSMLFVFGYRAQKIRSKKISVLIHNSDQHKNLTSCTVAVHFQQIIDTGPGDTEYDIVPDSKFVVSRTAFKDNSSYYKINNKKVQYKEVGVLLRGLGIDLDHNRFLILQGEVEQIAMMKPKAQTEHEDGMLEFLEDIIGTSRFKDPIFQLSERIEKLNEIREEKLNRVKVVQKEKDDLEGVKDEAVAYLTMENDIVRKKNTLYQKYVCDCSENEEKATGKRNDIRDGMKDLNEKLEELNNKKKEIQKEYKKIHKNYEELGKKCEETKSKFAEYEQQDVRYREDLKHSKGRAKKLEKTLEQEKKKLEELQMIPDKTREDMKGFEKRLEKLEAEKATEEVKFKEVMDSLKTETQGLQAEKDKQEEKLLGMQKSVNDTKSKYNVAMSELDVYISQQQSEEAKLRETNKNLENAITVLKERKNALKDIEKRMPETEQMLAKAQKDLQEATVQEEGMAEEVKKVRMKVEEGRSSLNTARSHGKVQDALMALKRSGRVPGIYGRLGDLGAIDEKYDIAVSTACGALDNMLVDNIDTAQKCVEFLKANSIGQATFIALDKMTHKWAQACSQSIKTPENVPRLFDLIKTDDASVRPAFFHALRNTLVSNDLDQATRIAYGKTRYRVVTLGGQLIELAGTMSGGGGRPLKGRMSSCVLHDVDPKELEKMEASLEKATQSIQKVRETKMLLNEKVHKLERTLTDMKHAQEKFTMEVQNLEEQQHTLKDQVKAQEAAVKAAAPDKAALKQLEKKVDAFKKEFEDAKATATEVEDEVHRLHKQIMDIGGNKLKAAESRLNLVQTQIDQVSGYITKANVAIKTAERNAKKSADKVKQLDEEAEENKTTQEKLAKEFKQLEEDATKVLEQYQQAQEQMKLVEDTLTEKKGELGEIDKEEQDLNKEHIEIKHEIEKYDTIIKDNQAKIRHWKKELSKLSLHKIDEAETEELPTVPVEDLKATSKEDTQYEITVLEEKLAQMKPNMAAIAEYRKKEENYLKRVGELDQITDLRDIQRKNHEDLRKQRLDEFMAGFSIITNKLKEMYQMITLGGDAELELVDSLDPFSEGIVFSVRPPKKSWKNISNLSGGEKTLSSLALVFALHHYRPTPLYVMDEIDAALDFKNVSIVAHYIKERTKNAQFIIISLRNNMFELADRLIGIYKTYNCTKSVTVDPGKIGIPLQEVDRNQNQTGTAVPGSGEITVGDGS